MWRSCRFEADSLKHVLQAELHLAGRAGVRQAAEVSAAEEPSGRAHEGDAVEDV